MTTVESAMAETATSGSPVVTAAILGACAAAQLDELTALESIYGPEIFTRSTDSDLHGAKLVFHTKLPKGKITVNVNAPAWTKVQPERFEVEHLPPLHLEVVFPETYPDLQRPRFLLKSQWLTPGDLTRVCAKLDDFWTTFDGMTVVHMWVDFLENDLLQFLGMTDELDLRHLLQFLARMENPRIRKLACKPESPGRERGNLMFDIRARTIHQSSRSAVETLKDYNRQRRQKLFEIGLYDCGICLSSVAGREMTLFTPCEHLYCRNCTRQHFITQINDGCPNGNLTCMTPSCTSEAFTGQIREIVGEEYLAKYDQILLNRYLAARDDITNCPLPHCQQPVIIDMGSSLAICDACSYSFCLVCRRAWHGVNPCSLEERTKLADRYMHATPKERELLEKKFSKQFLTNLVAEKRSKEWIDENSVKCPKCATDIEKTDGCNKMQCTKCRTRFCYLCGRSLEHLSDPYMHFNDPMSPCNRRLFEGNEDDEIENDVEDEEDDDLEWAIDQAIFIDYGEFENVDLTEV